MLKWRVALQRIGGTLLTPRTTFRELEASTPLGRPLILLGGSAAVLMLIQSFFLEPILRNDPLLVELPAEFRRAGIHFWLFRVLSMLGAPLGLALRSFALTAIVYTASLWFSGRGSWRALLSLVLHLEAVFVLETLCVTLILGYTQPQSYEDLRSLQLRAGLDLFWQPDSDWLRAALTAGNAFTLWWAGLLACGLTTVMRIRRLTSLLLALPPWAVAFAIRFIMQPR